MIPKLLITNSLKQVNTFIEKSFNNDQEYYCIYLKPQTTEYSIDQIREISKETHIAQPKIRVYILDHFDHSSPEAQNAFLKLLEEPPTNVEFILIVTNPQALLPTILSRTQMVNLIKRESHVLDENTNSELSSLIKDPLKLLGNQHFIISTKDSCLELLTQMLFFFRLRLTTDVHSVFILKEIIRICSLLDRNNLNPQLAIDHLLIFIAKTYNLYNSYKDYKIIKSEEE